MKAIKLMFIFILLIGGIFFLANWKEIIGTGGGKEKNDTEYIDINQKNNGIRSSWEKEKNWNAKLYQSHKTEILQEHSLRRYKDEDAYQTVRNCLRETATNKIYEAIFREFHDANCNDKLLKENYSGVDVLKKEENMDKDDRIKKIVNCYDIYTKISAFVDNRHQISAQYDVMNNSWTSFNTLKNNVINTGQSYRENTTYKSELSNINSFKVGLSHSRLEGIMDSQKNGFHQSLSNQIINHFKSVDVDEPHLARLNSAYDRYTRETSLHTTTLTSFVRNFRKEYEEKMKELEEMTKQ